MIVVDGSVLAVALADDGPDGDRARARVGGLDQRRAALAPNDLDDLLPRRAPHLPLVRRSPNAPTGGVDIAEVPERVAKGPPRHPVPVVILTRLAVHLECQGHGLGRALVRDALVRVATASHALGIRALLVHAKDSSARAFYLDATEFEPSPTDPLHLFLLMTDLRAAIDRSRL